MKFAVHVEINPLDGIADPEGKTIERALPAIGFDTVSAVRVGKVVRFELEAGDEIAASATARKICEELLANPVMESFEVRVTPSLSR